MVKIGATVQRRTKTLWDGWRPVQDTESDKNGGGVTRRIYTWGPDVSGSLNGAAGIGGLLEILETKGAVTTRSLPIYDGMGNVVGLVDAETGENVASYAYGPFGEPREASGPRVESCPLRFQTKRTDEETGFVYFGKRYYDPLSQVWISRDPLREAGGINLYAYCNNQPVGNFDPIGLATWDDVGAGVRFGFTGQLRQGDPDSLAFWAAGLVGQQIASQTTYKLTPEYWHGVGDVWMGYGDVGYGMTVGTVNAAWELRGNTIALASTLGGQWSMGAETMMPALGNGSVELGREIWGGVKDFGGRLYEGDNRTWGQGVGTVLTIPLLNKGTGLLSAKYAAKGGGLVDQSLVAELQASGIKITPQNVVATSQNAAGQKVFLEIGNTKSGLQHIVEAHGADFARIGISEAEIPSIVTRAVTEGRFIGYQGAGTGRPIYQIRVNGQLKNIAVTTGDNGYIVGANPASAP